jgi:Xaa-Pro aminopeptidase
MTLAALQKVLRKKKLNAALFVTTDNFADKSIFYLTGISVGVGFLIVYPKRKPLLLISPLEKVRSSKVSVKTISKRDDVFDLLRGRVGLNYAVLPKRSFDRLRKKGVKYV